MRENRQKQMRYVRVNDGLEGEEEGEKREVRRELEDRDLSA